MLLKSVKKNNRDAFWDAFFFVFGFKSNPILEKAKEIKSIDYRISESWERASNTFKETLEREECIFDE